MREPTVLGASALLCGAGAAATVYLHGSMAGGMPMAGGSRMAMPGMPPHAQTWLASGTGFSACGW